MVADTDWGQKYGGTEVEVTSMRREGVCSVSAEFRAPCKDRDLESTPLKVKAEEELTEARIKREEKITTPGSRASK